MNTEKIRQLLNDFYAGNTSPDDERQLRDYFFSNSDVCDEFMSDATLFKAMEAVKKTPVPSNLCYRIERATIGRHRRRMLKLPLFGSVAAAIAVILVILGITRAPSPYREVSNPDEAKEIAMQVSQKLQKNVDKLKLLNNINL